MQKIISCDYICDGYGCDTLCALPLNKKKFGDCIHTLDISHAVNFKELSPGRFVETSKELDISENDTPENFYSVIKKVVLCKNCKSFIPGDDDKFIGGCIKTGTFVTIFDYCSKAVPIEDDYGDKNEQDTDSEL